MSEINDKFLPGCVAFVHEKGYGFFKPDAGEKQFLIPKRIILEHELKAGDLIFAILGEYYSIKQKKKGLCVKKIKTEEI